MIVAGIGARPVCGADELAALLSDAAMLCGQAPTVLAVPWFRAGATVDAVARRLRLCLAVVEETALRAVQASCPTVSPLALAAHGIGSVAEGCALAVAGDGAVLLLQRIASANATCAIAACLIDTGEAPA